MTVFALYELLENLVNNNQGSCNIHITIENPKINQEGLIETDEFISHFHQEDDWAESVQGTERCNTCGHEHTLPPMMLPAGTGYLSLHFKCKD